MIIFGTRGISSTIETNKFYCPKCNNLKTYKHKKVTKFFTLYYIPLFPIGNGGEYIECSNCKNKFNTKLLNLQKVNFVSSYEKALRYSMIKIMLVNDKDNDEKTIDDVKTNICEFLNKLGYNLSRNELESHISFVDNGDLDVIKYINEIEGLDDKSKEAFIRCVFTIALKGGLVDAKMNLIQKMAVSLKMPTDNYKTILKSIIDSL